MSYSLFSFLLFAVTVIRFRPDGHRFALIEGFDYKHQLPDEGHLRATVASKRFSRPPTTSSFRSRSVLTVGHEILPSILPLDTLGSL